MIKIEDKPPGIGIKLLAVLSLILLLVSMGIVIVVGIRKEICVREAFRRNALGWNIGIFEHCVLYWSDGGREELK